MENTEKNEKIEKTQKNEKIEKTENQPTTRVNVSQQQKGKYTVSSIFPWLSYKSIIIVLCAAILFWMLLKGGNKREINDIFRRRHEPTTSEKVQSTIDNTKGTLKNSYEKAAESTKTTLQNVADKVKSMYDEKMNMDTIYKQKEQNKEHLKEKVSEATEDVKQTTKGTIESMKEKSYDTLDNIKTSSQEAFDTIKTTSQETIDKAKEKLTETQAHISHQLGMDGLIEQAYLSLQEFVGPHMKAEDQIPFKAFSGSKAVVFLTIVKGGVGLSGVFGTGIIIARNEIGHWSGPCAIALVGVDVGLNIGIEKSDHIIILYDDAAIRAFAGKGQFKLGIDASIAAGPKGREASIGFSVGDKGYASMFSYSLAKGAYIGLSFEGQVITVRNDCNEQYYGTKVDASKILDGTIKSPRNKHLAKIYKFIDDYAARKLVYPEHSTEL